MYGTGHWASGWPVKLPYLYFIWYTIQDDSPASFKSPCQNCCVPHKSPLDSTLQVALSFLSSWLVRLSWASLLDLSTAGQRKWYLTWTYTELDDLYAFPSMKLRAVHGVQQTCRCYCRASTWVSSVLSSSWVRDLSLSPPESFNLTNHLFIFDGVLPACDRILVWRLFWGITIYSWHDHDADEIQQHANTCIEESVKQLEKAGWAKESVKVIGEWSIHQFEFYWLCRTCDI